jgi:hypothetical protein
MTADLFVENLHGLSPFVGLIIVYARKTSCQALNVKKMGGCKRRRKQTPLWDTIIIPQGQFHFLLCFHYLFHFFIKEEMIVVITANAAGTPTILDSVTLLQELFYTVERMIAMGDTIGPLVVWIAISILLPHLAGRTNVLAVLVYLFSLLSYVFHHSSLQIPSI